jgi:hypothetical protein
MVFEEEGYDCGARAKAVEVTNSPTLVVEIVA